MGARKPVRYLAKAEHFTGGLTKLVMLSTGQIETNRNAGGTQALSIAVDVLTDGGWMGIFLKRLGQEEPRPLLTEGQDRNRQISG